MKGVCVMKKFSIGLIIGLLLASSIITLAGGQPIKLIVNGTEVFSDVPPQIIDGRTMIPARPLAEALGATVEWDAENNAVVVTGGIQVGAKPIDLESVNKNINQPINNEKENNKGENVINNVVKISTFENMRSIEINGSTYFNCVDFNNMFYPDLYYLKYNQEFKTTSLIEMKSQKVISEIPKKDIQIHQGLTYIHSKYYPNTATKG
jgi:hypothetical protein